MIDDPRPSLAFGETSVRCQCAVLVYASVHVHVLVCSGSMGSISTRHSHDRSCWLICFAPLAPSVCARMRSPFAKGAMQIVMHVELYNGIIRNEFPMHSNGHQTDRQPACMHQHHHHHHHHHHVILVLIHTHIQDRRTPIQ